MEILRLIVNAPVRWLLSPFTGVHPFWSLIPLAVLLGLGLAWAFGRLSNQTAIRETRRHISARLYELRLFVDEPRLIWQAQWQLLLDSFRLLRLSIVPAAVLAIPVVVLFVQLEGFYGSSPLAPGRAAIVTVQLQQPIRADDPVPRLDTPDGIAVATPALRVPARNQINWLVRGTSQQSGTLRVILNDEVAEKSISASAGPRYLSARRVSSISQLLWYPSEPLLVSQRVAWIEVDYPDAEIEALGFRLNWMVWLVLVSMIAALLAGHRLGVSW